MPKLLMISASPLDQDRLRLNSEFRDIRHALKRSKNRENWQIESNEAITVDDLRRTLLDFQPTILHFSGHGGGNSGLCFEDAEGNTHLTDAQPLAKLFHHFKEHLKCVVLNACYSKVQAEVIRKEIDYIVGMRVGVEDNSAAKFAVAFYDAIFAGTSYRTAFDLGCTALDLNQFPDSDVPIFMTGSRLALTELAYSAHIPEIETILYAYFNTPFNERATFTTTGEFLEPTLEKYYATKMLRMINKVQVISMKSITNEHWLVEIMGSNESKFMYIRIRNRDVLIEWEASVGLWSIPVKTYLALGSKEPVVARVIAELDTYYNFEFGDKKDKYQSVMLRSAGFERLHGYVLRYSDVYGELMDILADGSSHAITIQIIQATEQTDMPIIQKILSHTWIYSPKE